VCDSAGRRAKGATVTATEGVDVWQTTTNKRGKYSIANLPEGLYLVEAVKAGIGCDAVSDVPVVGGETTTVDLYLQ
jgi:hypothetical protein